MPAVISNFIQQKGWNYEAGLSRFIQEISDNLADSPDAPQWLWQLVMQPMLAANRIDFKRVNWLQPEDDIFAVGGHIQLIALMLKERVDKQGDLNKAIASVKSDLGSVVDTLVVKAKEFGEDVEELRKQVEELTGFKDC